MKRNWFYFDMLDKKAEIVARGNGFVVKQYKHMRITHYFGWCDPIYRIAVMRGKI